MAKIVVGIGKGFSGEIFRYEVDDSVKAKELVEKLVREICSTNANPSDYVLYNLNSSIEYRDDDTLAERGTRSGDIILLLESSRHYRV